MLKSQTFVTGAVACGVAIVAVALVAGLPAAGSATTTPTSTTRPAEPAPLPSSPAANAATALSSADIALVNTQGAALATTPGSVVSVVRGPGRAIWNAVSPDVTTLETTPDVFTHDFLLVTCTDNVLQSSYRPAPGARGPVVGEIQLVIDATTGHVLETVRIPKGMTNTFAPAAAVAQLGTPAVVTLSAASFG